MSDNNKLVEQVDVAEFQSAGEFTKFNYTLTQAVPEARRGDKSIPKAIKDLYGATCSFVKSSRDLGVAVYEFCEATGAKYDEVASAMVEAMPGHEGLSRSGIGKLYHIGKAIVLNPTASRLSDNHKIERLGRLPDEVIKTSLTVRDGIAMLGDQPAQVMKREDFIAKAQALDPDHKPKAIAPKAWDIRGFAKTVNSAIEANVKTDPALASSLGEIKAMLDQRIKLLDQARELKKAKSTKQVEQSVTATA